MYLALTSFGVGLLCLVMCMLDRVAAVSQLLGTISVDSNTVSDITTFNFDLISTEETVASNDYLLISLPSDLDASFKTSQTASCSVDDATIASCLILDEKTARITFRYRMTTT